MPQHPCTLQNCRKACHGCGHSCGHEYDAVERHLDKEKMRREGAESSNTNDGVICNGCYRKYKLAQELQDGVGEKEAEDVDTRKEDSQDQDDKDDDSGNGE